MAALKIYVNIGTGELVVSERIPIAAPLPIFYRGDTVPLKVFICDRAEGASPQAALEILDPAGISLKVAIGDRAVGSPTPTASIVASQDTWTVVNDHFEAALALNTAAAAALFATSNAAVQKVFEVEITTSAGAATVASRNVTVAADVIQDTVPTAAIPGDLFYTQAEMVGLFVKKVGAAGEGFILTSQDGTKQILVYAHNDGTLHSDLLA